MMSDSDRADQMGQATREKLKQFVSRIERLEAEKAELAADIREVYAEVKSFGFDTKIMRKVVSLRKLDAAERAEQEALLDMYMGAVQGDLFSDTKVTITAGSKTVETTVGKMNAASKALEKA